MTYKHIVLAVSVTLAGLLMAAGGQPRTLSAEEAKGAVAGVLLDNFRCQTVATCDTYNYPLDAPCPKSLPCRTCEFAAQPITNCVQAAGAVCDWRSVHGTKCGKERIGLCASATVCSNLVFYGTFCVDGRLCR